jgi:two-component system, OmpR family, phosphate regulon sensor histidine kinase PhoR
MKKNVIISVIIIITISLLGLIGIQLYWIRNAVAVKETTFNRGASEAVSTAIYKYNKLEMAHAIMKRQEQDRQVNRFFNVLDSLNREYYRDVLSAVNNQQSSIDDQLSGWYDLQNPLPDAFEVLNSSGRDTLNKSLQRKTQRGGYAQRPGSPSGTYDAFHEFFARTKIVNDLFDDLFSNNLSYSPSSEHGVARLDSLIKSELERQGIKTTYEFGIYDPVYNDLRAEKTGKYTQQLMESGFIFSLFPNDVFRNPEYLLVLFPHQKTYLMAQMNVMMAISSILILVIISSFTYTIITIVRQKKLSVIKNDFINNMTHELKTPISTISLACQALRDQDVQKSETLYQSYINVINEENLRLGMMTEKVLQTAQLEKGKLRLNKTGFNIHDIIEDAIRKTELQLKTRHGKITTELSAEFSFLEADKVHLTNLIFNLLDNAIKYSPDSPEIKIITENTEQGIIIHVEDKGIGISKVNQKKIFENLYRVSTGNLHNVKGFGLGLSYVKAIVEMHGGQVSLQSEIKKGSRFSVFIPFGFEDYPVKKS